jgi:hypothetical protein
MTRSESGFESEPDAWSETAVTLAAPVRNGKLSCQHVGREKI